MIYKKTLVDAHQMNYITVMYHNGFLVLQDILQIMVLFLTRNFILFLVIAVICTIIGNICMSRRADRLFPYLKEPCKEQLPQEERHDILRNVKAMLMHKIGNVVVNNTDNLLISSFVGIISAGIYSNYYLIIGSVRQVLEQAMLGVAASVGNLGVTEENEKIGRIFDSLFFIGYWLFGFASKKYHPVDDLDPEAWNALNLRTRYYTTRLHRGAFYLPAFLEEMLQEVED